MERSNFLQKGFNKTFGWNFIVCLCAYFGNLKRSNLCQEQLGKLPSVTEASSKYTSSPARLPLANSTAKGPQKAVKRLFGEHATEPFLIVEWFAVVWITAVSNFKEIQNNFLFTHCEITPSLRPSEQMQFVQSVLHNEKFTSDRSQDPNHHLRRVTYS